MMKEIYPLGRQCSRVEQRLLTGLRAMGGGAPCDAQASAALAMIGIGFHGVAAFAHLRLMLAQHGAAVRFLAPGASFVGIGELDLLASLHRLAVSDGLETLLQAGSAHAANPVLAALQTCALVLRDSGVTLRQRTLPQSGRRMLEQEAMTADTRRASSMALRTVQVACVRRLSPSVCRVTLAGAVLEGYLPDHPAQWLKLFAPMGLGDLGDIGRAYTIRHYRPALAELDIDVLLHDGGPLSRWAASAWVGQSLRISGACGGYVIDAALPWLLLAGDGAALPAIAAIVEALPAGMAAQVVVEVQDEGDLAVLSLPSSVQLHWTVRKGRSRATHGTLTELLRALPLPPGQGAIWVAAEAAVARAARRHALAERALPARSVHGVAYWKRGEQDHKDIAAG